MTTTTNDLAKEIVSNLKYIENEEEATELTRFAELHKLTDITERANELGDRGLFHLLTQ